MGKKVDIVMEILDRNIRDLQEDIVKLNSKAVANYNETNKVKGRTYQLKDLLNTEFGYKAYMENYSVPEILTRHISERTTKTVGEISELKGALKRLHDEKEYIERNKEMCTDRLYFLRMIRNEMLQALDDEEYN